MRSSIDCLMEKLRNKYITSICTTRRDIRVVVVDIFYFINLQYIRCLDKTTHIAISADQG